MENGNKNRHLTAAERQIIAAGISNGSSKAAIAETLGKEKSTNGKEIKLHRYLKHKCNMPLECANYRKCANGRQCTPDCPEYVPFSCKRRDRSPGACNGCQNMSHCRFDKYIYDPAQAEQEYKETLVGSREGVNLTTAEAKRIGETIAPLVAKGLSPYAILQAHPELDICEKTLYNYIEQGVLHEISGLCAMDLRRQVSRKLPKKRQHEYKKREDRRFLIGRTYKDYLSYCEENPGIFVVQMDTVYNDISNGPYIQTFRFLCCGVMVGIYHEEKTAASMVRGVSFLEDLLGQNIFRKYAPVLLTDRGSEFLDAEGLEKDRDGARRTHVFYCDPMQSGQKGSVESDHVQMRYILPKETNLRDLGLTGQQAVNTVLSHVNSIPLESKGHKTALELSEFMFPDLYEKLLAFGIHKVDPDSLVLKPYLLKATR